MTPVWQDAGIFPNTFFNEPSRIHIGLIRPSFIALHCSWTVPVSDTEKWKLFSIINNFTSHKSMLHHHGGRILPDFDWSLLLI